MNNHVAHYSLAMVISQCLRLSGQCISYPLIKAFVFSTRGNHSLFMDRRRHSHIKPSRVGFFRCNTFLYTHIQKDLKGYFPLFFQVGNVISIKISTTIKPDKLTSKHFNIRVVGDKGFIVAKCHQVIHGFTSLSFNQLRMLATAPLSVVGLGWGRWKTRTSPNKNTATREPSRSLISAPKAINKASMSDHLILALTGRVKISDRVLACLRFMGNIVLKNSITCKPHTVQARPMHNKYRLTREVFSRRMKSLTKTTSGHRSRQIKRIFYACLLAYSRLFYDGLREPNKTPLGNKLRCLVAVSEIRRPYLNGVALSKLKPQGGQNYA